MNRIKRSLLALILSALIGLPVFHFGTPRLDAQTGFPNNVITTGAALGSGPTIATLGLDTSVALTISTQGSGDINLTPGGTGRVNISSSTLKTDHVKFLAAIDVCSTDVPWSTAANLQPARLAAGDYALARTSAGAETYNVNCTIALDGFRTTASKGVRVDSLSYVFFVSVVALTNHDTLTLNQVVYANNVANAVTAHGGTLSATSFATATQANPYVTTITPGTPAFLTTTSQLTTSWRVIMANTGVYRLYGIVVNYTTGTF